MLDYFHAMPCDATPGPGVFVRVFRFSIPEYADLLNLFVSVSHAVSYRAVYSCDCCQGLWGPSATPIFRRVLWDEEAFDL